MKKKIINLFFIFIAIQIAFAGVYYLLYRSDNSNFFFLEDIITKQSQMIEKEIENDLSDLERKFQSVKSDSIGVFTFIDNMKFCRRVISSLPTNRFIANLEDFQITMVGDTIVDFGLDSITRKIETSRKSWEETDFYLKITNYNSKAPYNLIYKESYPIYPDEFESLNNDELKSYFVNLLDTRVRNFFDRYSERIDKLVDEQEEKTKRIVEVRTDNKNVWGFLDFLYFSFTKIGNSDILPNSTICRTVATIQNIIDLFLIGFLLTIITIQKNKNSGEQSV